MVASTIIAIDPGGTTGLATRATYGGQTDLKVCVTETREELFEFIHSVHPTTIIIERFATAGRLSKDGLYTIELVGGVKALCFDHKIPLIIHTPQQRKAWLHLAEAWLVGHYPDHTEHELDALAHLLCYEETKL